MGSAIMAEGWSVVQWSGLWQKVLKPSLIAPFAGLAVAFALMILIVWVSARRSPREVNRVFRLGQFVLGRIRRARSRHERRAEDDGRHRAGARLVGSSQCQLHAAADVGDRLCSAVDVGGHLRRRMADHPHSRHPDREDRPAAGFAAQTACASILWTTAHFGYPVSTTHVISGSVMGSGATRGLHAVRWGVAGNIVVAWIFTIPMAALVGAFMELVTDLPDGELIVFSLAVLTSVRRLRGAALGDPPATAARRLSRAHRSSDLSR